MIRILVLAGALAAGTSMAAQSTGGDFFFSPTPRWSSEPSTEQLCEVLRRECPEMAALPEIATTVEYDELYNPSGNLAGLRMTRGTGCAPYDESILVGRRRFREQFRQDGVSDLTDIRVELRPGIDPAGVRLVKHVESQTGMGCPS